VKRNLRFLIEPHGAWVLRITVGRAWTIKGGKVKRHRLWGEQEIWKSAPHFFYGIVSSHSNLPVPHCSSRNRQSDCPDTFCPQNYIFTWKLTHALPWFTLFRQISPR